MKKTLALLTAVMFTATVATAGTLGQWADQTSKKINQQEAAVTKKITDKENAYRKQQEAAQAKRDAQRAEQKAKQEAVQKRIQTKKDQWNKLIHE